MPRHPSILLYSLGLASCALFGAHEATEVVPLGPGKRQAEPILRPASDAPQKAIKNIAVPSDMKVSLWAAEPQLANPVAFNFDEKGRMFVAETYRIGSSVLDMRGFPTVLERDLASRTIEDRVKLMHEAFGEEGFKQFEIETEVVRLLEDRTNSGAATHSEVFSDGYTSALDGIASGVLARKGKVWLTNIPSLWLLERKEGEAKASKTELMRGFGIHFNYVGHDFHGLIFGPDGKIYMSIGDRGTHVTTKEGKVIDVPDMGSVFRCNPDGTEFELFASGLRNPQELAFDEHGNLFTGDNDSDNGDQERLVYLVEGGDSGWRIGYQYPPLGNEGPWIHDNLWRPHFNGQPAYYLPPLCNIEDGPSGVAYYPGTGLSPDYNGAFFICHFKGSITRSGVQSYKIKPVGASFEPTESKPFVAGILPTDFTFGPDGRAYVLDWVDGWDKDGNGRIWAVAPRDPSPEQKKLSEEVRQLLAEGIDKADTPRLIQLLGHVDQRVRTEAQFALAEKGPASVAPLTALARDKSAGTLARIHALWGLGQLSKADPKALAVNVELLRDADDEVRAQAIKVLGEKRANIANGDLVAALKDPSARVQFFAAQALGQLKEPAAVDGLIDLLRRNADQDLYLRHAAVYALSQYGATDALASAAKDGNGSVRLGALLVYRRLGDAKVADFLADQDPYIVREAALAINDAPVNGAMGALAAQLDKPDLKDHAIVLRAINAHFRLGQAENARALAKYAERKDLPEPWRLEALHQLGLWSNPPDRDRVMGMYRPLTGRDAGAATAALETEASSILKEGSPAIQRAALAALKALKVKGASAEVFAIAQDENASVEIRADALDFLREINDERLAPALKAAAASRDVTLRMIALPILTQTSPNDAFNVASRLARDTNYKSQRAAFTAFGKLDTPRVTGELVAALERLSQGRVAPEAEAELIEVASSSKRPEVAARFQQLKAQWDSSGDALAPFKSALHGGDPRLGMRVFYENQVEACVRCHKVFGDGGDAGPDLSTVAARKDEEYILESIVHPNAKIAEGFDIQTITLKNDAFETGKFVRETADAVILHSPDGKEISIAKADIKEREHSPSAMPDVFAQGLKRTDLRDLVAFLKNLKGRRSQQEEAPAGPRAMDYKRSPEATRSSETLEPPADNGEGAAARRALDPATGK